MNTQKLELMTIGGQHLGQIKKELANAVAAGVTPLEVDALADKLIAKAGDTPSFKTVRDYHHATCINVNAAVVHGIPNDRPFKQGDLVTIDVGLVHQSWHLDTSLTVQVPPFNPKVTRFLEAGQEAVREALKQALPGKTIYDVSKAMQHVIEVNGYSVIRDLTGHGIGHSLHEDPHIPCYAESEGKKWVIKPGQALAVEIMYTMGSHRLKLESDGWTLSTADGSLSAMFEETVFITESGQQILTS